jgi:hypothetical protein
MRSRATRAGRFVTAVISGMTAWVPSNESVALAADKYRAHQTDPLFAMRGDWVRVGGYIDHSTRTFAKRHVR